MTHQWPSAATASCWCTLATDAHRRVTQMTSQTSTGRLWAPEQLMGAGRRKRRSQALGEQRLQHHRVPASGFTEPAYGQRGARWQPSAKGDDGQRRITGSAAIARRSAAPHAEQAGAHGAPSQKRLSTTLIGLTPPENPLPQLALHALSAMPQDGRPSLETRSARVPVAPASRKAAAGAGDCAVLSGTRCQREALGHRAQRPPATRGHSHWSTGAPMSSRRLVTGWRLAHEPQHLDHRREDLAASPVREVRFGWQSECTNTV